MAVPAALLGALVVSVAVASVSVVVTWAGKPGVVDVVDGVRVWVDISEKDEDITERVVRLLPCDKNQPFVVLFRRWLMRKIGENTAREMFNRFLLLRGIEAGINAFVERQEVLR